MSSINAQQYGRVALLMGGWAAEREISLRSGGAVLAAMQSLGIDVTAIDVDHHLIDVLQRGGFDRVFNILHGRGGEDGTVQGVLEFLELPYTGSGVMASAIAMDKLRTKQLWRGLALPTPIHYEINSAADLPAVLQQIGLPMIVKPALEGSSIGMSKVEKAEDLAGAWQQAKKYGAVFAEKWITGREYTASILNDQALPLIRLETPRAFYDFNAKYQDNQTRYHCPCGLSTAEELRYQALALQAFHAVGASGWGRVDLMVEESGEPWLIEVNTVPGMTDHSLVPMAAKQAGFSFEQLVAGILDTSFNFNFAAKEISHGA
ncbi:MAG: D-alanine--D-alanine ligase [Gammaproteobacteria bacterium]|nr:D-alanine--D-alanine ligase [Gammaproteobacteria bacterium]